jgi:hypothetical protein
MKVQALAPSSVPRVMRVVTCASAGLAATSLALGSMFVASGAVVAGMSAWAVGMGAAGLALRFWRRPLDRHSALAVEQLVRRLEADLEAVARSERQPAVREPGAPALAPMSTPPLAAERPT